MLDEGDSQSVFWGGNHTGIYAGTHPNVVFHGNAVGGSRIGNLVQRFPSDSALKPTIVTILIGANDLADSNAYASEEGWLTDLWNYVAGWKALGAKVLVGTVLPQCVPGFADNNARNNSRRIAANAAIRAAVGSKIDGVIDYAADPQIGPDAAACDKAFYLDGLHPSDGSPAFTGGQGVMAKVYGNALDAVIK